MKNHRGTKRGFYELRAHSPTSTDGIALGFYGRDGGTSGEFCINWVNLGSYQSPRIEAFQDSWDALYRFSDVLRALAALDGTRPSFEDITKVLSACGLEDRTDRRGSQRTESQS